MRRTSKGTSTLRVPRPVLLVTIGGGVKGEVLKCRRNDEEGSGEVDYTRLEML